MNIETLERANEIKSQLKDLKVFLESSSSNYSKLELIKERAESNMGSNFTVNYRIKYHSELGKKIIELLKAHKSELEAEFEKL